MNLYHYCSCDALYNIAKNKFVWASHSRYMNDSSEWKYAISLTKELLQKYDDELMKYFSENIERFTKRHLYIACFSEAGDSLSQWRAYCPSEGGYSIGFDKEILEKIVSNLGFRLLPCIYDRDQQLTSISTVIRGFIRLKVDESNYEYELNKFMNALDYAASLIKDEAFRDEDEAFRDEKEWRIIIPPLTTIKLDFRPSKMGMIPYIKVPTKNGNESAMKEIIIGPMRYQDLSMDSLPYFLKEENEWSKDAIRSIKPSFIPFRTS